MMQEIDRVIRKWASRKFAYGMTDCCRFAADVVLAKTGTDFMDEWYYADEATAKRLIQKHGGLRNAITSELGEPCDIDDTTDGDVLLVHIPGIGDSAAVRFKDRAIVRTMEGVTDWSLDRAICGWSV